MSGDTIIWEDLDRELFFSSTKVQNEAFDRLEQFLSSITDASDKSLILLQGTLLKHYPQLASSPSSRNRSTSLLLQTFSLNTESLGKFVKVLDKVLSKSKSIPLEDLYLLSTWINSILKQFSASGIFATLVNDIVSAQLALFDALFYQITPEDDSHKSKIRKSIVKSTTSAFTNLSSEQVSLFIKQVTRSKISVDAVLSFIGAISSNDLSSDDQNVVVDYYTKVALASKTPLSNPTGFEQFSRKFVSAELLKSSVIPALEKAIMRSSELSLSFAQSLFTGLDHSIDLPELVKSSKLLTQLISSIKSSKETVRQLAFDNFVIIIKAPSTKEALSTITEELLKAIKTISAADQKSLVFTILALLPSKVESVSSKVITALVPLITKDQNELSLSSSLKAFFVHFLSSINTSGNASPDAVSAIVKGFQDSKIQLKRLWFINLGAALIGSEINENVINFLASNFSNAVIAFDEIVNNPTKDIKGIVVPYVTLYIAGLIGDAIDTSSVFDKALTDLDKPSILLNTRVYSKLSTSEEKLWFIIALSASTKAAKESNLALGKAWISFILSKDSSPDVRQLNTQELEIAYQLQQEIVGDSLIKAITEVILNIKDQDEFTTNFVFSRLSSALHSFSQSSAELNSEITAKHLSELIIAAHHEVLPSNFSWISLVLGPGLDPGNIVNEYHHQIISSVSDILLNANPKIVESGLFKASTDAVATLAFISPSVAGPSLDKIFKKDLDVKFLASINDEDVRIWKCEEGSLVVNVLESKKKAVEDKNSKDYETRKWEESLKKELSKKNQSTKKLTKEELEIVAVQLAKESTIRQRVNNIHNALKRSLGIIESLSKSGSALDNGQSIWFASAVNGLLSVFAYPVVHELIGPSGINAFLDLSNYVSPKLGNLRYFLGIATLRIENVDSLDKRFKEEDLLDLISRLLFRVKFLSVNQPFDQISLVYLLPLLSKVLEQGKIVAIRNSKKPVSNSEFVEEDKEEEQLLLALEIISNHAELFKSPAIPRSQIIHVLLSLLALPSKAKLAKDCLLILAQNISIEFNNKDLEDLFSGLLIPETFVRNAVLEALDQEFDLSELKYADEIWIACHDNEESNSEIALTIWQENKFKVSAENIRSLYNYLGNSDGGLRLSAAKALADAIRLHADEFPTVLTELLELYSEKARPPEPILDEFGFVVKSSQAQKDHYEIRSGLAITLKYISSLFDNPEYVSQFIKFIINERALADKEPIVSEEFKEAAIAIINKHGAENVESLIPIFEESLASNEGTEKEEEEIREKIVVLYGYLAKHLSSEDDRLVTVTNRLLSTLQTPSEKVQVAIADVIAPLVPLFKKNVPVYIDQLFKILFESPVLSRRRGAAYGIAGLVKGYGISAIVDFDIIRNLSDAADDKKDPKRRESVSAAFECLSKCLGKFFEPYVIEILPVLLKSLGDSVPEVRDAAANAAKVIMSTTTSYGVKKLVPLAIGNLDEISWRSKKGSVELLGSMAYLDPTQLSASLSTIVPEIVGVLNDSHKEVRKAADQSLKRFGEVIRNPEIQSLVPVLIQAIGDPTKYTEDALDSLIKTQFVHYIDGPSLAIIIHVIHRGMRDRSANTKRKACQIVGNMAILVDTKDLIQYLPQLVAELEIAMVDPVPNTRATAARALGALVEKLGEENFPTLIPRLLDTLADEVKAGDRLGSAQALAEVVSGIGIRKLDEVLPIILKGAVNSRASVREGFLPMLLFLPVTFGSQFAPYVSQIIPAILNGLADTDESIRATALKAGRLLVKNYANKAIDLLLPELESGLLDSNYRIRASSVELIGDLLFQVTGISGKNELVEDESEHSGKVQTQLIEVLGAERRDRILSLLFICRSDSAIIVRNAAIDIWKSLVANTPRTVKEILPTLTNIIIRRLSNSDESQRNIAAQTLGDLVRRVGANALSELLPTLQESLQTSDPDAKQGICIAIHELLESTSENNINTYQDIFVAIIRSTLIDSSPAVRETAATAFDAFQNSVGKVAIDKIIPYLLNMLQSSESDYALSALQEIMTTKSEVIFPILIPTLLASPIDAFRANALGSMAEVAGSALYKRLSTVINTLVTELVRPGLDEETENALKESFDKITLSVENDEGLHPLLQQLLSLIKGDDIAKRAVIYDRLPSFFVETRLDYSIYTQDIATQCILSLDDKNSNVVAKAVLALTSLVKQQSKESLERLIKPSKQALQMTGTAGVDLAGFVLPKGPNSILPIFLHGLMYGSSDQREASAFAIADVVSKTPSANLKPLVTVITGPLIRVVGERFSSDIKAAILFALNILLEKIPQFLRPFIPQLQRTFVKSLSDANNETLRSRAAKALGTLIEFQTRIDPLVSELTVGAKNSEISGVKAAMLKALLEVLTKAGEKLSQASKNGILDLVEQDILEADDKLAVAYARLVGALSRILTIEEGSQILKTKVLNTPLQGDDSSKFAILTLNAFLKDAPNQIFNAGLLPSIVASLIDGCNAPSAYISDNSTIAIGKLLLLDGEVSPNNKPVSEEPFEIPFSLVSDLTKQLAITTLKPVSNSLDTRRYSLVVIRTVARMNPNFFEPHFDVIVPSVFASVRDAIIPIKLAAEKAYLSLFNLVDDDKLESFNKWFEEVSAKGSTIDTVIGTKVQLRSIGDYTKRVGVRLAGVERERISAGGDDETLFSDRIEDENEIWAVGGVDLAS